MRDLATPATYLLVTIVRLLAPGGARTVVAESLLLKHQLLILNRTRTRAPALQPTDRVVVGLCAILIRPTRLVRSLIVLNLFERSNLDSDSKNDMAILPIEMSGINSLDTRAKLVVAMCVEYSDPVTAAHSLPPQ